MAFNLSNEEHQKVCDEWKPSYTDAEYKAFCYLLDHAEDTSVRKELGPSLDRYSPENLFEMVSEARFLTAVQCVVSDYAQDSHRGRKEGPEYTTPDFWENIEVLGYPSQFFWTDLQCRISELQRKVWYTTARIYDINDKPTPEEQERFKALQENFKKSLENLKNSPPGQYKLEVDEIIQRSKKLNEASYAKLIEMKDQIESATQQLQQLSQQEEAAKPWWKRFVGRVTPIA